MSLVIQLAPEVYGVVALGKTALTTYPSKTQALKAADVLDDAAFKAGQIKERAPTGTERQVLQAPEVKAQITAEANRKAAAEAAEAELKANEIVVTGRVKSPKAIQSLAEIIAKRKALATEFYKQQGFPDYKISSHLDGIDFTKPVEVITLKLPQRLVQHQVPGGPQGNYYSITGTSPEKLGISAKAQIKRGDIVNREATIYNVVEEVKVLRSKAATVTDTWSLPGKMIKTDGGGTQFFTTNASAFKAIK